MLDFTLYTANCVGMSGNCLYPNKVVVKDKESFKEAVKKDHVRISNVQIVFHLIVIMTILIILRIGLLLLTLLLKCLV